MARFIVRRLAIGLGVLFVATVGVFVLVAESGDPLANLRANPNFTAQDLRNRAHALGLDQPVWKRYWLWIIHALQGNFGRDLGGTKVAPELRDRMFVTLRMVLVATLLSIVIAVAVGLITALRRGKVADHGFTVVNFIFLAAPVFVVGLILKEYVATPIDQHFGSSVLPTLGANNPADQGGLWSNLPDVARHMALPTLTLIIASYASWAIYQRSTLLDVMDSDYVRFARAKGISPRRVLFRHILRNALIPITTVVALDFAAILGGAVVTETIYGWDGLGRWYLGAVTNQDTNVILAYLVFTATIVILFNIAADIVYGFLDPRIRYE
jgi:peptide/nickel transport system permease protein